MIIFAVKRLDGTIEHRRHIPFDLLQEGSRWKAVHAGKGHIIGRFDTVESAERSMRSMTEVVPHYKAK
jgi:hypothetical protein